MLYDVEVRENNTQEFDNWVGDYTEAESEEEAIELVKQWLIDNGYTDDVEELEFRVDEFESNITKRVGIYEDENKNIHVIDEFDCDITKTVRVTRVNK